MKYLSCFAMMLGFGTASAEAARVDPSMVTWASVSMQGVETDRVLPPRAGVGSRQMQDGQITPESIARALADLELYLSLTEGLPGAQRSKDRAAAKLAAEYLRNLLRLN